ncbi:MAG TPA: Rieske 2Fe-2S domain-containing protein [Usitatibacter sp.]|nr:Rieske 2Fe-2S domain-containing protein [Usitatibacter sp.]
MAAHERLICASAALADGGPGVRFALGADEWAAVGFAIRYFGTVYAYVNRCPHAGTELDWQHGEFFEESGLYLVCATHGALFLPPTGLCVAGPCKGACLRSLRTREENGRVLLVNDSEPACAPDETP